MSIEIGKKYNKLTVLSFHSKRIYNKKFECVCECGNKKIIEGWRITSGVTQSCGCYQKQRASEAKTKHGYCKKNNRHPLYGVWGNMKNRCLNKKLKSYKNYGGRGIKICEEWLSSPKVFIDWCLLNGWKQNLEIDRINNEGNYEPENCRFVTISENQLNTRKSINSLASICREKNINYRLVKDRIRQGWTLEKALNTKKRKRKNAY